MLDTFNCSNESVVRQSEKANSENELIRAAVALNPSATTSILVKLFSDESEHLQECLRKRNDTKH